MGTIRYGQAMGGAPNGFIERRSYSMEDFSNELERRLQEMMRQ